MSENDYNVTLLTLVKVHVTGIKTRSQVEAMSKARRRVTALQQAVAELDPNRVGINLRQVELDREPCGFQVWLDGADRARVFQYAGDGSTLLVNSKSRPRRRDQEVPRCRIKVVGSYLPHRQGEYGWIPVAQSPYIGMDDRTVFVTFERGGSITLPAAAVELVDEELEEAA